MPKYPDLLVYLHVPLIASPSIVVHIYNVAKFPDALKFQPIKMLKKAYDNFYAKKSLLDRAQIVSSIINQA